jgi:thymidine phosphorylase
VARIDAREVGLVTVDLGGGRHKKGDPIDHRVGVVVRAKVGIRVAEGAPLCDVHAADETAAAWAARRLQTAFTLQEGVAAPLPVILDRVGE